MMPSSTELGPERIPCWIPGAYAFVSGLGFVIEGAPVEDVPKKHLEVIAAQHALIYHETGLGVPKKWFGLEGVDLTCAQPPDPLGCIKGFIDPTSDSSGIIWIDGTLPEAAQKQQLYHSLAHFALGHTRRGRVLTEDRITPTLLVGPETRPQWSQEYDADKYAARVLESHATEEFVDQSQIPYLRRIAHRMEHRALYIHDRILSRDPQTESVS